MKKILIATFTLFSIGLFAQQAVIWKGGTTGKEVNWNEARNWSNNKVPNKFSDVVNPDVSTITFAAPIIAGGSVELNSIQILSNGRLRVDSSIKMIIYEFAKGIVFDKEDFAGILVLLDEEDEIYVNLQADEK